MSKEIDDIDDLIAKVLANEATEAERTRLDAWSKQHDDNRKYVEQFRAIFNSASAPQVQLNFDTDAAWNAVRVKLHQSESKNVFMSDPWTSRSLLRIAAGVVILMGIGFFTYEWMNPATQSFATSSGAKTVQDTLPDGSTAFLNRKSSITYEYNSRQRVRKVKLSGEGFFEVKHDIDKPFTIEAEEVLIRDIGTSFNVKAYPESDTITVSVKEGEVQVYTLLDEGLDLKAGETGIYSKRLHAFTRLELADTNVLAYKTGILSFNNTYLKSIIERINDLYDARIRLENPALGSCRMTVNFRGDSVDTIVEVISETLGLTVTRDKKEIILSGQGCN